MKLAPREVAAYCTRPDPDAAGLLIHGSDPPRVALRRAEALAALTGPDGAAEMRLTRIEARDLRGDPALLNDALRSRSFFPGPHAVHLEAATDSLTDTIAAALGEWQPGDAQLIVTAAALPARSRLRKLFEAHPTARAAAIYDDPPGPAEIDALIADAGLAALGKEARAELGMLAAAIEPGDFRQTLAKLALYKHGDAAHVSVADVAAVAPAQTTAGLDDLLAAVAEKRMAEVTPLLRRLQAQGVLPVTLCIAACRHFRQLHAIAAHPGGGSAGVGALRPPVFGPRRDRLQRQAAEWGLARLERALRLLIDTDLALRSGAPAPAMALVERALIRLSHRGKT